MGGTVYYQRAALSWATIVKDANDEIVGLRVVGVVTRGKLSLENLCSEVNNKFRVETTAEI